MNPDEARQAELIAEFGGRHDEAYAAWSVERATGVRVEARDIPGAPRRTVDAELIYPDGNTAALEITSVEASGEHHLRARLGKMRPTPSPGNLMWTISPRSIAELNRLVAIHEAVIAVCEQHGIDHPMRLPFDVIAGDPDLRWLVWEGGPSRMSGHPVATNPRVWWMEPSQWAVFGSEADEIAAGVASALAVEPCVTHVDKLLNDPHDERHLFLIVGSTGLSTAAAFALIEASTLPSSDPDLPEGIDHLWLGPGWGRTVTAWSRGGGWRNVRVLD